MRGWRSTTGLPARRTQREASTTTSISGNAADIADVVPATAGMTALSAASRERALDERADRRGEELLPRRRVEIMIGADDRHLARAGIGRQSRRALRRRRHDRWQLAFRDDVEHGLL